MATPSPACPPTNCPTVCSPTCTQGYTCTLGVIDSLCECPTVSCVKVDFDTGTGDSGSKKPSPTPSPTSKSSVLGPVLGGVFGLIAVALITFFLVRRQRRRRRTNAEQERGGDDHTDHTLAKVWPATGTITATENKDVIRIAFIPGTGSEASLPMSEAPDLGGAPQASFMALMDENHNKHDSMASTISTGTLDQAIHMAVKAKATPQVIRLNTIKAANSDLIQRSNSLHSSNSIKRTKSQRRLAEAKQGKNSPSSPLGPNPFEQGEAQAMEQEEHIQEPEYDYTPAVMLTGPSARSSAQSSMSVRRIPGPTMVLEPRPIQKLATSPSSTSSTLVSTPTTTPTPTALVSLLASVPTSPTSRNPFTSPSPSPTTASYPPIGAPRISFEPTDPFSMEVQDTSDVEHEAGNLRPWTSNRGSGGGRPGHRDSTFSTGSDARSLSTRADGEEIMIFWDGHRDSKVSLS
ncbi:hypothetical protein MVEG_06899 [Podila verticillata NRRL 6337]|nr:hypothetical protein MVEG_06899 [Podila verticillata NRRL 6337]